MAKEYIEADEMERYDEMRDELAELPSGLTAWELDFLETMFDVNGLYTVGQAKKIEEIWEQHCDG